MSIFVKLMCLFYSTGVRGGHRLFDFLSNRFRSFQRVEILTENGTVVADLRISSARGICSKPYGKTGEDLVMKKFISEGDVCFDIGAHFGIYTLLLSKLAGSKGKVFAFEPNPRLRVNLRQTIRPLSNVTLFEFALSDKNGQVNFYVPEDASMASLSNWTQGTAGSVYEIVCETRILDDLVDKGILPIPHFIKCDVEGAEILIFKGGKRTLNRKDAPIILFEVNSKAAKSFGFEASDYFEFLESVENARYRFFEVLPDRLTKLKSKNIGYANVLAIPESKVNY